MNGKFQEYNSLNLAEINKSILSEWQNDKTFEQSIKIREKCPDFVFYEGPPSANGLPGIHHVVARTVKDVFCRYKTMKGFNVPRKAGWDTHGLPVELGVEKMLNITKDDIGKKISIEKYNNVCKNEVLKFTSQWENLTNQMGYWVDMKNPYITCNNQYIESVWYLLKELYNKNLLYKGHTIQPYSPAAGTGLSSHELNQPGCYKDVKDLSCIAQFQANINEELPVFLLAWTTTPWTLPSNTALCINANITYAMVKAQNPYTQKHSLYIVAKDRINFCFDGKKSSPPEKIKEIPGEKLLNIQYNQLIPFIKPTGNAFKIIHGDFVSTAEGTGIVHIAPTFGADDAKVATSANIASILLKTKDGKKVPMVDLKGKFYTTKELDENFVKSNVNVELYKNWEGKYVKPEYAQYFNSENTTDLNTELCMMLKTQGKIIKTEKYVHSYPHCWRTDKPILYYPIDSWFIKTSQLKNKMAELNNTINWKPQTTGSGRFGKWLENLNDWNLSRSRYWGTPLPIWRTNDNSEELCIGSTEELISEINKAVKAGVMTQNPFPNFVPKNYSQENYNEKNINLHRPYVDNIILISKSGKPMKRQPDLIDVWFDSGAMPYAQCHYPFSTKKLTKIFPADFIAEGVDQTRGWFFTLHAIAVMIFNNVAFKNVVSNGLVLDKNGNKMSKRLGNAVNPFEILEKYGADPLRWYMITNASPWDNLKFDQQGVEDAQRKFFNTLHNTYSFFALYANVDGFNGSEKEIPNNQKPEIDRWIISLLNSLIKETTEHYDAYEPTRAGRAINDFVNDNLSNWYVRLNRKRFWGGQMNDDKLSAYQTLYQCLKTIAKLIAPITPFYADKLWKNLNSIH
jgi:isoleucyl-tRNA synthetase